MCDCHSGLVLEHIAHLITVADHKSEDLTASKEKGNEELEVIKRESQAKSQKILKLEEELQAKQKELDFLTDQFEQLKHQQGKDRVSVANSQVTKC